MAAEFKVKSNIDEYSKTLAGKREKVETAAERALRFTAEQAADDARREYKSGLGHKSLFWQNFGDQWNAVMHGKTGEVRAPFADTKAVISHPSGRLAEEIERTGTATIHGKPLLWLPTTEGAPRAGASGRNLVSATVRGQPMLFDADDRNRDRKPLYVGVPTVRVKVGVRVLEIIKKNLATIDREFQIRD